MKFVQPVDRKQFQLMNSLDDLVAENSPVRIIDAVVEKIVEENQDKFGVAKVEEVGRPRYSDLTMLKLYLYGYFNGVSSSRKLEVETQRNIEVIWLLGSLSPDHWTISNYRKEKAEEIKFVTKKFREFLKKNEYIKLKTVAIDGSKVKANTNREALTKEKIEKKLKRIDKRIDEYLKMLTDSDLYDDAVEEIEEAGYEEVNKKYIDEIIKLQKQVEKLQEQKAILEKEKRSSISKSDYDARLMKSRDGLLPGYNIQIVVDAEEKMIADSEVLIDEADKELLSEMTDSIEEELSENPDEVITDIGYNKPDAIEEIEKDKEIKTYVAQEETKKDKEKVQFEYDEQADEYICSEGKRLVLLQKEKKKNKSLTNVYRGIECKGCRLFGQCTKSEKGRMVHRYLNQEWRDQYKKRMRSRIGRIKTSQRKGIVEHPFGTIKCLMGKIPILLRGIKKVATEINLYTTVYNLKRLINIEAFDELMYKIERYNWKTA